MQENKRKYRYLNLTFCIAKYTVLYGIKYMPILLITLGIIYLLTGTFIPGAVGWCMGKMCSLFSIEALSGTDAISLVTSTKNICSGLAKFICLAGAGFYVYAVAQNVYRQMKGNILI